MPSLQCLPRHPGCYCTRRTEGPAGSQLSSRPQAAKGFLCRAFSHTRRTRLGVRFLPSAATPIPASPWLRSTSPECCGGAASWSVTQRMQPPTSRRGRPPMPWRTPTRPSALCACSASGHIMSGASLTELAKRASCASHPWTCGRTCRASAPLRTGPAMRASTVPPTWRARPASRSMARPSRTSQACVPQPRPATSTLPAATGSSQATAAVLGWTSRQGWSPARATRAWPLLCATFSAAGRHTGWP
mmetsp:Transcript_52258/g.167535  ORF Transcript_52258/g.167535 Transcript_52258/m.167535 type:complete len:246 (+) Transcript_52258:1792-2529(+)